MKKLLTLTALVAGVALFAGCLHKPAVEDEVTTPTVEETTLNSEVTTEEVTPAAETSEEVVTETTAE